jgi:hypothetical protein
MTRSILGTVLCGVIVGALAFFMPHLLIGLFILCIIVKAFHCCGRRRGCCGHGRFYGHGHERLFYMADKIRKMTEEEYEEFKNKMGGGCCDSGYHSHGHCCGSTSSEEKECCQAKKEEKTK